MLETAQDTHLQYLFFFFPNLRVLTLLDRFSRLRLFVRGGFSITGY